MQELSWGRNLAIKTIKSIIASGRCNAARKQNKELAAAGSPAPRGRPPMSRVPQPGPSMAQKQAMPQAMPEEEAERRFTKQPRHGPRHSSAEPGADADGAAEMVLKSYGCR